MKERLVARITADFFLRYADLLANRFDGSFQRGIIFLAIVQANIEHIGHLTEDSLRYADLTSVPPDDLRRPAPINAIAASLNLPYETVRRHVHALIDSGQCQQISGKGVVIPSRVLEDESYLRTLGRIHEHLKSMFSILRAAGIDLDDEASTAAN